MHRGRKGARIEQGRICVYVCVRAHVCAVIGALLCPESCRETWEDFELGIYMIRFVGNLILVG